MVHQKNNDQPGLYRITVQGTIREDLHSYFEDFVLCTQPSAEGLVTTLTGRLADQAALQGLVQNLYSLCLPLVSIEKLEDDLAK